MLYKAQATIPQNGLRTALCEQLKNSAKLLMQAYYISTITTMHTAQWLMLHLSRVSVHVCCLLRSYLINTVIVRSSTND